MASKVFVSVGSPGDDSQREFRDAVVRAVSTAGLMPRLMTDLDWDYQNPLRGLRRAMSECTGAIVIAYTRYQFPEGTVKEKGGTKPLSEIAFPTPWNQIEAAMAYEKGMPLLVIAEEGLRREAILEPTSDVKPFWTKLDPDVVQSDGFIGYLRSWKEAVESAGQQRVIDDERRTRGIEREEEDYSVRKLLRLFMPLPWYEGLAFATTVVGFLVGAMTVGYRVGAGEWPF